jgi:hypothetical protein
MHLLAAGVVNFLFIGLKAFQQRNVIHNDRVLVMLTSNLLAMSEVFVIAVIARSGWYLPLVLILGVSGGFGCLTAMTLHNHLFKRS